MRHCLHCGHTIEEGPWPQQCSGCQRFNYNSPKPVVALVLREDSGVLVIKRGIEPFKDTWAFPGGYIDYAEDWHAAAVREAHEELGIQLDPEQISLLEVVSTPNNYLVLFVGLREPTLQNRNWTQHDLSKTLNDTGEQEILAIDVWHKANQGTRHLGVMSHNTFFQKMDLP